MKGYDVQDTDKGGIWDNRQLEQKEISVAMFSTHSTLFFNFSKQTILLKAVCLEEKKWTATIAKERRNRNSDFINIKSKEKSKGSELFSLKLKQQIIHYTYRK